MKVRERADCLGNKVGAVLVREDRVISTGYNILLGAFVFLLGVSTAWGGGWYLVGPPIVSRATGSQEIWWLLPTASLRAWERLQAFDSAAACEDEREKVLNDGRRLREPSEKIWPVLEGSNPPRLVALQRDALFPAQMTMVRCIASDDPGLR